MSALNIRGKYRIDNNHAELKKISFKSERSWIQRTQNAVFFVCVGGEIAGGGVNTEC